MLDTFDPYHKWLGIPPDEQPPNHYRLLGIAAFEADADVIDAAANQRMAYLQDMAVGPHVEHSQRLLNEISAARRCLLNPEAKSAYDAQLQATQQPVSEVPFVPIITTDAPAAAPTTRPTAKKKATPSDSDAPETAAAATLTPAWIAAFSSIGVLSLIIALFLIFGGSGDGGQQADSDSGTLKVKWKLDERESALMMIDGEEVFDSVGSHPDKTETLTFSVKPGRHDFFFEREGYRAIRTSYKFLPGESHGIELQWRRR